MTIVAFANNASAYSHPSLGRFISRDPGPARVGSGGIATGGHFVQRDPILEYAGGMNLYEYTHSRPVSLIDPDGLLPVPGPEDMLLINHYERGNGEFLQLTGQGWYNKILPSAPAQAIQQSANAKAREFARNTALSMSCNKPSGNFQMIYTTPADFTDVVFSIGNTHVRTLLVCNIGIKCKCSDDKNMPYEYGAACRTFHVIMDRFEDALDIFDLIHGRQELPTGTPFTFVFAWEGPIVTDHRQLPLPSP
ncbi:MAG: hypothetical protein IT447_16410 [Phycisphaerales bacterium]|nr:hypothetical protein [Phycisphaerales bacterium]